MDRTVLTYFKTFYSHSSRIITALRVNTADSMYLHVCVKREMDPSHNDVNTLVTRQHMARFIRRFLVRVD
jgi:hypothetical protein